MKTVFSTAAVHPRHAYDYWHEVLCKQVVKHDCRVESRHGFWAELQAGAVADIELVGYANAPMYCCATVRHARHANGELLYIIRHCAGVIVLEQDGREVVLQPGDMTLFDPRRPGAAKYLNGSKLLILKVPRSQLQARVGDTRSLITRSIKPSEAEHRLTSAFLAMLPDHSDALSSMAANVVKEQALDLIAVSLAKAVDLSRPRLSSARSVVLVRVRAAIEALLTDPALDAETVAAAAGVSVRYANAVLAADDTSIMRLVQARRLERCRRALDDPGQAHRTVSEIAYGWGFSDITHFGRRFKGGVRHAAERIPPPRQAGLTYGCGVGPPDSKSDYLLDTNSISNLTKP